MPFTSALTVLNRSVQNNWLVKYVPPDGNLHPKFILAPVTKLYGSGEIDSRTPVGLVIPIPTLPTPKALLKYLLSSYIVFVAQDELI